MSMKDPWESVPVLNTLKSLLLQETSSLMVSAMSCCKVTQYLTVTEPGFYEDGKFGIRIESKLLTSL